MKRILICLITYVEEIINSAKYLNTNCFLTSLLKNNFENFGSDFGYATNKEDPRTITRITSSY